MGYQTSETHDQFRNEPDTIPVGQFAPDPQGFVLSNHHTDGPSKVEPLLLASLKDEQEKKEKNIVSKLTNNLNRNFVVIFSREFCPQLRIPS